MKKGKEKGKIRNALFTQEMIDEDNNRPLKEGERRVHIDGSKNATIVHDGLDRNPGLNSIDFAGMHSDGILNDLENEVQSKGSELTEDEAEKQLNQGTFMDNVNSLFGGPGGMPGGVNRPSVAGNSPIQVGSYGGSIVGNVPIFAANTTLELGNTTERETALNQAAQASALAREKAAAAKRKGEVSAYGDPIGDMSVIDDAEMQAINVAQTQAEIESVRDKATYMYGDRDLEVLTDPKTAEERALRDRFQSVKANRDAKALSVNRIGKSYTDYLKAESEGVVFSPAAKGSFTAIQKAFADPKTTPDELMAAESKFRGHTAIGKYITDNHKAQVTAVVEKNISDNVQGSGRLGYEETKGVPQENRKPLEEAIFQEMWDPNLGYEEEEFKDMISNELDAQFREARKNTLSSLGVARKTKEDDERKERLDLINKDQKGNTSSPGIAGNQTYTAPEATTHKPVRVDQSVATTVFDANTGEPLEASTRFNGYVSDIKIVRVYNKDYTHDRGFKPKVEDESGLIQGTDELYTSKKGAIIIDSDLEEAEKEGAVGYQLTSFGTVDVLNPEWVELGPEEAKEEGITKTFSKEVYFPSENIKERIQVEGGTPITGQDGMDERVDGYNYDIPASPAPLTGKKEPKKTYTDAQEAYIKENMKANPTFTREQVIKELGL